MKTGGAGCWVVTHYARPVSLNDYRNRHWATRGDREWREAFCVLALEAHLPKGLEIVSFHATALGKRPQDPGNCYPSIKAAIDGLVDAGLIDDDTDAHVAYIRLNPWRPSSRPGLELVIVEEGR